MAKTTDTTSIFRIVAIVAILLLIGAAALSFMQGGAAGTLPAFLQNTWIPIGMIGSLFIDSRAVKDQ